MRRSTIEVTGQFDAVREGTKYISAYNKALERTKQLHDELNKSNVTLASNYRTITRAQADVLINLTKANNALLQSIDLNSKNIKATKDATAATRAKKQAVDDETKALERKAALESRYYRELDRSAKESARAYAQKVNEQVRQERALTKAFEDEMNKRAAIANREWRMRDQQRASLNRFGGIGLGDFENLTQPRSRAAAARNIAEVNRMFAEGARAGRSALREHVAQIKETQQATDVAAVSTRNWLGAMLAYRLASAAFHTIVKGANEAKDAIFDLEKQASRTQRVLGSGSRGSITAGLAAAGPAYNAEAQQSGEALYQITAFEKNPVVALKELDTVLKVVKGTESDARETARLLMQMYNLFGDQIKDTTDRAEKFRRMGEMVVTAWKTTQTEVPELIQSFKYLGAEFKNLQVPVEQQVSTLAYLDYVGQRSSQAGTGLRNALQKIVEGAEDSESAMSKLLVKTKTGGLDLHRTLVNIADTATMIMKDKGIFAASAFITNLFPDVRGATQVKSFIASFNEIGKDMGKSMAQELAKSFNGVTKNADQLFKDSQDNIGDQMSRWWKGVLNTMALDFSNFARRLGIDFENLAQRFNINLGVEAAGKRADERIRGESPFQKGVTTSRLLRTIAEGKADWDVTPHELLEGGLRAKSGNVVLFSEEEKRLLRPYVDRMLKQYSSGGIIPLDQREVWTKYLFGQYAREAMPVGPVAPISVLGDSSININKRGETPNPVAQQQYKAELRRQEEERQKAVDKKRKEAIDTEIKRLDKQIAAENVALEALNRRMQDDPTLANMPAFKREAASVSKTVDRLTKRRAYLQGEMQEYAARERYGMLPSNQFEKDRVQNVNRATKELLDKQKDALEKRREIVELQLNDAKAVLQAMKERQGIYAGAGGPAFEDSLTHQAKAVDFYARKRLEITSQIKKISGEAPESIMEYILGIGSASESLRKDREATLKRQNAEADRLWKEQAQELERQITDERRTRMERIRENSDERIFRAESGYRPNLIIPGESARSLEARRYSDSRARLLERRFALEEERAGYLSEKLPNTVSNLAANLEIDKKIASVNRELSRMKDSLQDIDDQHAADALAIFNQELRHTTDIMRARADIALNAPIPPGVGNDYRRGLARLYSDRTFAQRDIADAVIGGESQQVIDRLQVVLEKLDADIRNAPLAQYYATKAQIQSQVTSGVVGMWRGTVSPGQFVRGLGDTITERAISSQAEKLFDPLITTVANEIFAIETNTRAINTLTSAVTGSSSGQAGGGNVPGGVAAVGGLIGAVTSAARGDGDTSPASSYKGSPANRPLSKRNTSEIAGAALSAYSIFKQGQESGVTLGGVLGGALAGGAIGGPVGAVIGGGLSLLGGLFGHKKSNNQGPGEPSFFNSPSTFDYWAYRRRATGELPSAAEMGLNKGTGITVIQHLYVDGVKRAVHVETLNSTKSSVMAGTNSRVDMQRPM